MRHILARHAVRRLALLAGAGLCAALLASPPALAQARDPAYQAARSAGLVGEQPDGYLGIVGTPTAALRALVDQINLRRREVYTARAAANGSTIEEYALTTGCNLILQTVAGERYRAPTGEWLTRTAQPPVRLAACPAA
jgi:uncharacterized protein